MKPGVEGEQGPDQSATLTLVGRLRNGDADAAGLLDHLYRDSLARFCWGYLGSMEEAEDALQDIWYKVLTASHIPDAFRPWVYRIARNECLNLLRKRAKRKDGQELPAASQVNAYLTGQLTRLVKDETESRLGELVASLSDPQREALRLRYVEGLSRAEIAEVLEVPSSVVKSRLFEGLKKLRDQASLLDGI
ncbi:MAG: RNA polymerase sigma factor [Planctomycetota bacterium]|jgi:RNA polymerase sigma-70 factor (ECF subfamily)